MLHEPQMERTGDPEEIKQKMMSPPLVQTNNAIPQTYICILQSLFALAAV